jgi:hypothetical protein
VGGADAGERGTPGIVRTTGCTEDNLRPFSLTQSRVALALLALAPGAAWPRGGVRHHAPPSIRTRPVTAVIVCIFVQWGWARNDSTARRWLGGAPEADELRRGVLGHLTRLAEKDRTHEVPAPHPPSRQKHAALHCIALHCAALHCIALHCMHCIALHCIALHCIALHCIALHCIALDLTPPVRPRQRMYADLR